MQSCWFAARNVPWLHNDLESKLFLDHIFLKKTEISKSAYFALSSLLVVAKSTLNFFSSWAYHSCCFWTSLLPCWFEKQAAVKYKSAYLWKHASCKLFPFSKLYCFGLDKKNSLSWNLRLNSWPLHYFVKLNQEKRWNISNCDCWDKAGSDGKLFRNE